jgi:hypothetical protein
MSDQQCQSLIDRLTLLMSADAALIRTEFARNTLRDAISAIASHPSEANQLDLFAA